MDGENKKIIKNLVTRCLVSIGLLLVSFGVCATARAATLFFSPSSSSCEVGSNIALSIYVGSADQAMNAASGVISFPADKLEVNSISKDGSIFSLWVLQPSFSNANGTVNFEGVVFTPGFTGASGKIVTINFKAKQAGSALISFSSGMVLANDGEGTNILSSSGKATINITAPVVKPKEEEKPAVAGVPAAPKVSSQTHADSGKWYNNNNPKFGWTLPSGVSAVNVLADRNSGTNPGIKSDGFFSSYTYEDVDDGIWYFHVRLKNSSGWGAVSHFKFQIDTETPEYLNITEIKKENNVLPRAKFKFESSDKTSKIDYYEIQIDNGAKEIWRPKEGELFITQVLNFGRHKLFVSAVDRAGNSVKNSAEFSIQALLPPNIVGYFCLLPGLLPEGKNLIIEDAVAAISVSNCVLRSGDTLIVKGKMNYPGGQAVIYLQKDNEEAKNLIIKSDSEGNFIFAASNKLKGGVYQLWAEAIDESGTKSAPSEKISIVVEGGILSKMISFADFFAALILFIILIILLVILFWYVWHKFSVVRKKMKKEDYEVDHELYQSFNLLKKDIDEQVKKLGKARRERRLTKEEEEILKSLKNNLK
ncbi:MAG: cohesin domain-containing protein [bacterium]